MGKENKGSDKLHERSDKLHERISNRKPHSFLHEQVKRKPEIVDALLVANKQLEKDKKIINDNYVEALGSVSDVARSGFEKEKLLFKEYFEQISEKYLPIMKEKLAEISKTNIISIENIQKMQNFIRDIEFYLRKALYRGGTHQKMHELLGDFHKVVFDAYYHKGFSEELTDSFLALEIAITNSLRLHHDIVKPTGSNWKHIDDLENKNKTYLKIIHEKKQKEKLERQKGPVITIMNKIVKKYSENIQQGARPTKEFSEYFFKLLNTKFWLESELLDEILNSPFNKTILGYLGGESLIHDFSHQSQIKIIKAMDKNNSGAFDFFMETSFGEYVKNLDVARVLLKCKNNYAREYLLYNKNLSPGDMADHIIPVLKKDENEHINMLANERKYSDYRKEYDEDREKFKKESV